MDQMVSHFSCKRKTNRWPLAMFFNLLDVSTLAAFVMYRDCEQHVKLERLTDRKNFLLRLAKELVLPNIVRRAENKLVIRNLSVRTAISAMLEREIIFSLGEPAAERDATGRKTKKGSCYQCPTRKDCREQCTKCAKPICAQHTLKVCSTCL